MKKLPELIKEHDETCDEINDLLDKLEKMAKEGKDTTETNEELGVLLDKSMKLKKTINNIIKSRL